LDAWVPNVTIERFAAATHWIVHEEPERVAQRILEFMRAPQVLPQSPRTRQ